MIQYKIKLNGCFIKGEVYTVVVQKHRLSPAQVDLRQESGRYWSKLVPVHQINAMSHADHGTVEFWSMKQLVIANLRMDSVANGEKNVQIAVHRPLD